MKSKVKKPEKPLKIEVSCVILFFEISNVYFSNCSAARS